MLALSPDGIEDFHGGYEEYLERQGPDYLTAEAAMAAAPPAKEAGGPSAAALGHEQRKARKRDTARLRKKVQQLEKKVAALEGEMERIDTRFAEKDYYDKTSWGQIEKDERAKRQAKQKLEATLSDWEGAAGELEALQDAG